jgi:topoisomerase IV subunit A
MSQEDNQKLLLASSAGYGFICKFSDLVARNRNGKAIINLPKEAKILAPIEITSEDSLLLSITQAGRMLIFPVKDLPELAKGKGNKIVSLAGADDSLAYLLLITPETSITLYVGKRKLTLNPVDLQKFRAERARKGSTLPRGLQKIDRIEVNK